jgi:glycosyltransferase involved in cell wall biosynthesis
LSVGELIPRKNHEVVIRAIAQLDNKHIHYFIAGDGELQLYLSELSEKLGVKEQIHFLGYRKDINKLCNSADIYILPSLQEGLSVALMEAMATCKVIIASRIRGNVDLIDEDKGGVLVAAKDVEEYARAISYVITNKNLWDEIGKHNIEKVKNFSIESVQEQMELVYELLDN